MPKRKGSLLISMSKKVAKRIEFLLINISPPCHTPCFLLYSVRALSSSKPVKQFLFVQLFLPSKTFYTFVTIKIMLTVP